MVGLREKAHSRRAVTLSLFMAILLSMLTSTSASAATEQTSFFSIARATRARAMAAGPEGNVWFVAINAGSIIRESIGRVTAGGQVTEFPVPERHFEASTGPAIVMGPEGNLWFAESGSSKVGRITPDGQITEFPLSEADDRPGAIATGADGGIWFTEEAANKIGRVHGAITEFLLPPGSGPAGITPGPDGNLWFTEKTANKIGRITPNGSITEFPVPTPGSLPRAITLGPDGNLWFTEEGPNQVGRITPLGAITEFPVPGEIMEFTADPTGTEAIVAGPDGDIWFTSGTYIGSITPSGRTADPACLDSSCRLPVASLTVGPEESLWFGGGVRITEGGGGTALLELNTNGLVGRFVPPPPSVAIGPNARPTANRRTDLRLSCEGSVAGERCSGMLRLVKRLQARGQSRPRKAVIAHSRYELFTGESTRLPLRLSQRAMQLLSRQGSLSVHATVTLHGHVTAVRRVVLRERAHR